jgi:hypothetical protein
MTHRFRYKVPGQKECLLFLLDLQIRKLDDLDVGLGPARMGLLKTRYVTKLGQVLYFLRKKRFFT